MEKPSSWVDAPLVFPDLSADFRGQIGDVVVARADDTDLSVQEVAAMVAASCMDENNNVRNPDLFRAAHVEGKRQPSSMDLLPNNWAESTAVPPDAATLPTLAYEEFWLP